MTMIVSLQRILNDGQLYKWAVCQMAAAFPPAERRDADLQRKVMSHPDYHLCAIMDGLEPVGVVGYWETRSFIYFENFCVQKDKRNKGYGSAALSLLTSCGKTFILEIEPPIDSLTRRRRAFYLRNGMVENPYYHIQPHYRTTDPDLPLLILTYGEPISPQQYAAFRTYLDCNVDVKHGSIS